jgi:hypothetical protein
MEQPLVTVAGIEVDVERAQVEREVSGDVRTVDDRGDSEFARTPAQLRDRQGQRRRRRVLTQIEDTRARPDVRPHGLHDLLRAARGSGMGART